jgi:hypothetical protein
MNSSASDPGYWPRTDTMPLAVRDRVWGIGWQGMRADTFEEWRHDLTRTPGEYSSHGGEDWSPSHAELAARLHVDAELVRYWSRYGIDEPWEIAVVRAYARTGMVIPPGHRVSPDVVREALGLAKSLEVASAKTGIPLSMLQHHLEVGAPAKTHGRMYTLMASDLYREAAGFRQTEPACVSTNAVIRRMAEAGATLWEIANEVGMSGPGVMYRMKKLGIPPARAMKGGRTLASQ